MNSQPQRTAGKLFFAGLILAVLCLVLLGWLSNAVLSGVALSFDHDLRALVHASAAPGLTFTARMLSQIGEPLSLAALGLVVILALRAAKWNTAILLFAITMAGAFVLDGSLKAAFHRARPEAFFDYPLPRSYSFPSGHALFAACFFGFIAAVAALRLRTAALKILIWILAAALVLAIGLSRIYLGVHYPSDVLAGYAAAVLWVGAVACGYRLVLQRRRARAPELIPR